MSPNLSILLELKYLISDHCEGLSWMPHESEALRSTRTRASAHTCALLTYAAGFLCAGARTLRTAHIGLKLHYLPRTTPWI